MAKTATRTDETLWRKIVTKVKAGDKGGEAGQWSARKAQIAVALYKQAGGGYVGEKSADNSLAKWTRQKWRTKSGKPSLETGERYLPEAAIAALTDDEYRQTSRAKRAGMHRGTQFVPQPNKIAAKTAKYRAKNPTVKDLPALAAAVGEKLHDRGYATSLPVAEKGGVCLYSYTKTYGVPVVILFQSDNDKMISMSFYQDTELESAFEQIHGYNYFFDEKAVGGIFEVVSRFNAEIANICKNTMSVMDCLDVAGEDYFDFSENYEE
jgi:hypothetical protein